MKTKFIFALTLLLAVPGVAAQTPQLPHVFDGSVEVDGDSDYSGVLEARSDGQLVHSTDIQNGEFENLIVSGIDSGSEFSLFVDGLDTGRNVSYDPGSSGDLDISFDVDSESDTKVSSVFESISSGDEVAVEVPEVAARDSGSVEKVSFDTSNLDNKDLNSNVTVSSSSVDIGDGVDEYLQVDVEHNLEGDENNGGTVTFLLDQSSVESTESVKLYKDLEEGFEGLETDYIEEVSDSYRFEATTDSYSTFVAAEDTEDPSADIGVDDSNPEPGEEVEFDASDSSDNVGISSYSWDFGDGEGSDTGETISHTFDDEGTYTVELTVSDQAGNEDTDTVEISVEEPDTGGGGGLSDTTGDTDTTSDTDSDEESEQTDDEQTTEDTTDDQTETTQNQTESGKDNQTEGETQTEEEDQPEETQQGITGQFVESPVSLLGVLLVLLGLIIGALEYTGRTSIRESISELVNSAEAEDTNSDYSFK